MSIIRYEPVNTLNKLRGQLNDLFEDDALSTFWKDQGPLATSNWSPSVDVKEDDKRFIFLADIPGVEPKDIEVTCKDGVLIIKGERKTETTEDKDDYKRVERSSGTFYRRFTLPDTADTESIEAKSKNGVLELTIPKTEKAKARRIEIKD